MYYLIVVVLLFVAELFYFRLADRFAAPQAHVSDYGE